MYGLYELCWNTTGARSIAWCWIMIHIRRKSHVATRLQIETHLLKKAIPSGVLANDRYFVLPAAVSGWIGDTVQESSYLT